VSTERTLGYAGTAEEKVSADTVYKETGAKSVKEVAFVNTEKENIIVENVEVKAFVNTT